MILLLRVKNYFGRLAAIAEVEGMYFERLRQCHLVGYSLVIECALR
jgi:hypothetical protein